MDAATRYISFLCGLLISRPLRLALMKVGPSHRMSEYVAEYARPENARDTTRGAPSAWKALTMMPTQAAAKPRRLHASDLDSAAVIVSLIVVTSEKTRV